MRFLRNLFKKKKKAPDEPVKEKAAEPAAASGKKDDSAYRSYPAALREHLQKQKK